MESEIDLFIQGTLTKINAILDCDLAVCKCLEIDSSNYRKEFELLIQTIK